MTEKLLSLGADPNIRHKYDITPVSIAIQSESLEVIQLLFQYSGSTDHGQLLHCAAQRTRDDRFEVLKYIIDKYEHPPVDQIMYQNDLPSYRWYVPFGVGTPLHYVAANGDLNAAQLLVRKGANPSTKDPRGQTAIDRAERYGHNEVAQYLRSCKVTPGNTFGEVHGMDRWGQF